MGYNIAYKILEDIYSESGELLALKGEIGDDVDELLSRDIHLDNNKILTRQIHAPYTEEDVRAAFHESSQGGLAGHLTDDIYPYWFEDKS